MDESLVLSSISNRINELFGLHVVPSQWNNLARNLSHAANALGLSDKLEDIHDWLSQSGLPRHESDMLAQHLTVGETYFFRELVGLNLLSEKVIPFVTSNNFQLRKRIRIWSAGCSSGEEPYTIAMVLKDLIPDIEAWDVRILATDVNKKALEKARLGVYTPWSFRNTPEPVRKKYFKQEGKNFRIIDDIKEMVHFAYLNLATADFPAVTNDTHNMDVIFCRNVLMYMSPEKIHEITRKFEQSLNVYAWLIISQVELNDIYFKAFQRVFFENGFFYRKVPLHEMLIQPVKVEVPAGTDVFKKRQRESELSERILTQNNTVNRNTTEIPIIDDMGEEFPYEVSNTRRAFTLNKAMTLFSKAMYSECMILCEEVLKNNRFDADAALLLAKSYANLGKLHEAAQIMEKLLASDSTQAEFFYLYATILAEMMQLEKADHYLVKALYLKPAFIAARLCRSQVLMQMGNRHQADKELSNLLNDIDSYGEEESLEGLDGMTAGRMRQMAEFLKGITYQIDFSEDEWRNYIYDYCRMIEKLDADLGRLLDAVDSRKDETLVIFTSDHGDGLARHKRVQKWHPFDESMKVPFIAYLPGKVKANVIDDEHIVSLVDIMPTVCDYAGIPAPPNCLGRSIRQLIETGTTDLAFDTAFMEYEHTGRVVRKGDFKYVKVYEYSGQEDKPFVRKSDGMAEKFQSGRGSERYKETSTKLLFDLKNDPWETRDLSGNPSYSSKLDELEKVLAEEWESKIIPGTRYDRN